MLDGRGIDAAGEVDALLDATMAGEGLRFMYLRSGNPYGDGVLGLLHRRARLLRVAEALDAPSRRVVIAHELGHWFLHPDPRLELTKLNVPPASLHVEGYSPAELKEVQADVFGAEFLCPCDVLRADFAKGLRPSDTARRLGVPVDLAQAQAVVALLCDHAGGPRDPTPEPKPDPTPSIATSSDGTHLLVEGPPSSGRTTAALKRVSHLLAKGRSPASIAVLARSERAAEAMHRGLRGIAGGRGVQVWSGTMQGYCKEILRKYAEPAGLSPTFSVVDDVAAIGLVILATRASSNEHVHPGAERPATAVERAAATAAYRELTALKRGAAPHAAASPLDAGVHELTRRYDDALAAAGALDAAGLAHRALELLEREAGIASRIARLHEDIVVDDYDDMTRRQQEVLRALSRRGARIFATSGRGSIDGFRGADAAGTESFEDDFPGATRIPLAARRDRIVLKARVMRALASSRPCAPARGAGLAVGATVAATAHAEAAAIARRAEEWTRDGVPLGDQVVLTRNHLALERLAVDLRALGLEVRHDGEADGREAFADLLAVACLRSDRRGQALARVAAMPIYAVESTDIAAATAMARRHGMTGLETVRHLSRRPRTDGRKRMPDRGLARLAMDLEGLETSANAFELVKTWLFERSDHLATIPEGDEGSQGRRAIRQFLGVCEEHERQGGRDDADLARRLRRLRSRTQDTCFLGSLEHGDGGMGLAMMTIHAARGRSFQGVHLAALPPPCAGPPRDRREARVFEVAITRARSKLHLTRCLDQEAPRWAGRLPYAALAED